MTLEDIKVDVLATMYTESVEVRAIVDWLDSRKRDPRNSETRAGNLQADLANRDHHFSTEQLRVALERIAKAGCGTYHAGRPIENSRIRWDCSARQMAAMVKGQKSGSDEDDASTTSDDDANESETHYFPVRPGLSLPVTIRLDMTASELENMADFVKIIAKSRGNAQ